jgi:hypothetical protein
MIKSDHWVQRANDRLLRINLYGGVASLWLILSFPQHVYDRGGRADLTAASTAVRKVYDPQWLDKLTRFLPEAGRPQSDDDVKQDEISDDEGAPAIEGS